MEIYGIKVQCLNWSKSYLKNQQQFLSLGKKENSIYRRITFWNNEPATLFKAKKLFLNISEKNYSLFHSTKKTKYISDILPPLHIDNVPFIRKYVTKFLGVSLDESISWKHNINIVSTKVCKKVLTYATDIHNWHTQLTYTIDIHNFLY